MALVSNLVTAGVVLASATVTGDLLLTLGVECLASAGTAYFVSVAATVPTQAIERRRLTAAQSVSVVLVVGL